MSLADERGYAVVTIADITEMVGVSRRTFSNYFAGKAECIAAVTEGWFDDIAQSIRDAPDGYPLDQLLCERCSGSPPTCPTGGNGSSACCMSSPSSRRWSAPSTRPTARN